MLLFELVKKNFKVILRNPLTLLLLFLLPIILILLLGISFSSDNFQEVDFGLINSDKSLINLGEGVNLVDYDGENAKEDCIYDLDRGNVKICLEIKLKKSSNGEIIGSNVIYHIDNTHHILSNVIEGSLDRYLSLKGEEFSKQYLDIILNEANNSLSFMKEARASLSLLEENLDFIEKEALGFRELIPENEFSLNFTEILLLRGELNKLNSLIEELNEKEEYFLDTIEDIETDIELIEQEILEKVPNSLELINSTLNALPEQTPPEVRENLEDIKVTLESLNDLKFRLDDLKKELNQTSLNLENLENNFLNENKINDSFELLEQGNDVYEESQATVTELREKINLTLNLTREKKLEVTKLKTDLDEMINFLENYSSITPEQIINPINVIKNYRFMNLTKIHQFSPIIIIMVLLFIGILLSNTIVSFEINSKAYFRNNLSPIPQGEYILGLYLTSLIIILFEVIVLFLFLEFYFNILIFSKFWELLFIIIHILTPFILLGIFYGYYFDNPQVSIILSVFSSIGLFLLSNILVPLEIMPSYFSSIIQYSPVVIGIEFFREMFFYSIIDFQHKNFLFLYFYIFILIGLIQYSHHKRKSKNL